MDHLLADQHTMPPDFVVLNIPSYDGAQYYQIARNVPQILQPSAWQLLANKSPGAYAYQRILLPALAFVLSLGFDALLPYAFLLIHLASLVGAALLMLQWKPHGWLQAFAVALSPAAMVGLHFSLAEPLTIFLVTAFLIRFIRQEQIEWIDIGLLSLLVLTREVNILFVGLLLGYSLLRRRLYASLLLLIPITVFITWHGILYGIFGDIPFLWSAEKRTLPFVAIAEILSGAKGFNSLTLSSIGLFFLFVLPAFLYLGWLIIQKRAWNFIHLATFGLLLVMTMMPDHIWGSITSIGRVITPVYPLFIVGAIERNTTVDRILCMGILLLGIAAAVGLGLIVHPYSLTA
jgi:hypothetical protein